MKTEIRIAEDIRQTKKIKINTIETAIAALKEIQNRTWILVTERLPDESDYYCVTTEDVETDVRIEQTIWFAHKDDYDIDESEWRELADYEKVIAWRKSDPYTGN